MAHSKNENSNKEGENIGKEEEDQHVQEIEEINDLKNKLRISENKLKNLKAKNEQLIKEKTELQEENSKLQKKINETNYSLEMKNKQLEEFLEHSKLVISQNADLENNDISSIINPINYDKEDIKKFKESLKMNQESDTNLDKYSRLLYCVKNVINIWKPNNDSEKAIFSELKKFAKEDS